MPSHQIYIFTLIAWVDASFNIVSDVSPRQLHQGRLSEFYVQFRVFFLIHTRIIH